MNCGQPLRRLEEVERVAGRRGVEHEQVVAVLGVDLVAASPSPCTPASRRAPSRAAGRCGCRGSARASRRRARGRGRPRRRSPSRRASSPRARRRRARRRPRRTAPGRPGARSLPSSGRPSESASRLRRVDRQHRDLLPARRHPGGDRRRGRRLADAARARADADPLAGEQLGDRRPSGDLRPEGADLLDAELGLEEEGQGRDRRLVRAPRRRASCSRWSRRPAALAERGAAGGADRRRRRARRRGAGSRALGLLLGEALGVERRCRRCGRRDADLARSRSCSSDRGLVDRHLLRQGDDDDAGAPSVADERVERLGLLARIGPTRATLANVRGVCRKPTPCPVAGASTITRS